MCQDWTFFGHLYLAKLLPTNENQSNFTKHLEVVTVCNVWSTVCAYYLRADLLQLWWQIWTSAINLSVFVVFYYQLVKHIKFDNLLATIWLKYIVHTKP